MNKPISIGEDYYKIKVVDIDDDGFVILKPSPTPSYYLENIKGYKRNEMYESDRGYVSKESLSKLIPISESVFVVVFEGGLETFYQVYKLPEQDAYIKVFSDYKKKEKTRRFMVGYTFHKTIEGAQAIVDFMNEHGIPDKIEDKVHLLVKSGQSLSLTAFSMKPCPIDIDKVYNDDFKEVDDLLIKNLETTTKGIAILHGSPGTGKSNYIKNLPGRIPEKNFVFIPNNMISALSDPSILPVLMQKTNLVLILEDCEEYLKSRDNTMNSNSLVDTVLNLTDGILSDIMDTQVIATFNTSLTDIDSALLRNGRLICEYEFKPLEESKAAKLYEELGVENPPEGAQPLSKIFNYDNLAIKSTNKEQKTIGFGK